MVCCCVYKFTALLLFDLMYCYFAHATCVQHTFLYSLAGWYLCILLKSFWFKNYCWLIRYHFVYFKSELASPTLLIAYYRKNCRVGKFNKHNIIECPIEYRSRNMKKTCSSNLERLELLFCVFKR